jgi:uncharacterized protein (TIGR02246 family)
LCCLAIAGLSLGWVAQAGSAAEPKDTAKDADAISKNAEAFVEAFHKGDAEALAAFWTPDGDHTDQTGRRVKGRKAIEKAFKALFAENKGLKLRIDSLSLRFITPDVAVEDGTTEVVPADGGPPTRANYTIIHVKKEGQWLLSSVRNTPVVSAGGSDNLRGLDWAIGEWAGKVKSGEAERLSLAWDENENFIVAKFSTTSRKVLVAGATQWIGWDPAEKRVRSWIFDSTGGFGEGTWTEEGKKWTVKAALTLKDGKKATATFHIGYVDARTITLQSTDRTVNGEKLPDSPEIKLKRVK